MYHFLVDGLSCKSCVHRITEALKELDGSIEVKIDLKSQSVQVHSPLPGEKIRERIEKEGYSVTKMEVQTY